MNRWQQWLKSLKTKSLIGLWQDYGRRLVLYFGGFLLCLFIAIKVYQTIYSNEEVNQSESYLMADDREYYLEDSEPTALNEESTPSSTASEEKVVQKGYVDIKGAVKKPSIYPVDQEMRIYDVIDLAGGLTSEADQTQINLAQRVSDQMVIYIPKKGEQAPDLTTINTPETVANSETSESSQQSSALININTADSSQLQEITGIGEKKATEIIQYRENNGSFQTVDELTNVNGIGEKTLENIRSQITVE